MELCLFGGASGAVSENYIREAERLGGAMAARGHGMIFGGGASGMMGAAARGAHRLGGRLVGVAPRFFDRPGILYPDCTELILTETMDERKALMETRADGFVVLPGGIGTLDEFFEVFTLQNLGKLEKPVAVFDIGGYYELLLSFLDAMTAQGFLSEAGRARLGVFRDAEELLDFMERGL